MDSFIKIMVVIINIRFSKVRLIKIFFKDTGCRNIIKPTFNGKLLWVLLLWLCANWSMLKDIVAVFCMYMCICVPFYLLCIICEEMEIFNRSSLREINILICETSVNFFEQAYKMAPRWAPFCRLAQKSSQKFRILNY